MDDYTQKPFSLRFVSDEVESNFLSEYASKIRQQVGTFVVLGTCLYSLYFWWDYLLLKEVNQYILLIRIVISTIGISLFLYILYSKSKKWLFGFLVFGAFCAVVGIILMIWIMNRFYPELQDPYYPGILLVLLFGSIGLRIRFIHALVLALITVALVLLLPRANLLFYWNQVVHILTGSVIVVYGSYCLEFYARDQYKEFQNITHALKIEYGEINTTQLKDPEVSRFFQKVLEETVTGIKNRPKSFNVEYLAERMAMAKRTLQANFQKYLQVEPRSFIKEVRIKLAVQYYFEGHSFEKTAWEWGFDYPYQKKELHQRIQEKED